MIFPQSRMATESMTAERRDCEGLVSPEVDERCDMDHDVIRGRPRMRDKAVIQKDWEDYLQLEMTDLASEARRLVKVQAVISSGTTRRGLAPIDSKLMRTLRDWSKSTSEKLAERNGASYLSLALQSEYHHQELLKIQVRDRERGREEFAEMISQVGARDAVSCIPFPDTGTAAGSLVEKQTRRGPAAEKLLRSEKAPSLQ